MNVSKKIIIFTIFGSLILAVGVFIMVTMTDNSKDVSYVKISSEDQSIGSWSTEKNAEKADSANLTFKNNGKVTGQVSGYNFSGTYKKLPDDSYVIFNKKGKETYTVEISKDEMSMNPVAQTLTVSWTLTAN